MHGFAGTNEALATAKDQHVLVRDQVNRYALGAGATDGHESEHGCAVDDLPVADGGEHRGAPLYRDQPSGLCYGEEFAG
jgi:hypothetical protein